MGRTARGVKGMKLKKDQRLISLNVADPEKTVLALGLTCLMHSIILS